MNEHDVLMQRRAVQQRCPLPASGATMVLCSIPIGVVGRCWSTAAPAASSYVFDTSAYRPEGARLTFPKGHAMSPTPRQIPEPRYHLSISFVPLNQIIPPSRQRHDTANNAWSIDLYAPHRNLLASKWPRCARLKFCYRTTGATRVARRRAFYLAAVDHDTLFSSRCCVSLSAYFRATRTAHYHVDLRRIPAKRHHDRAFSISLPMFLFICCSAMFPFANDPEVHSSIVRDTLRARLFVRSEKRQPRQSLRDVALTSSGVKLHASERATCGREA